VTVAVGMALLGIGLMINSQVTSLTGYWTDKVEVSVYLCKKDSPFPACKNRGAITQEEKAALEAQIRAMPQVESVEFVNQAQAYKVFQGSETNTVLRQAVKVADLPESFRVKLKDPDQSAAVMTSLEGAAGVSSIINTKDLVDKFFGFLEKLRNMALAVALIMVFAATLLIGNTVRLSAYNRRRETGIMRLVGASNVYIQLPFVMEGTIAGLIGGVFSAVLLIITKTLLFDGIQGYMAVQLGWNSLAWIITLTTVIGVVICILASFITLRRYLRV
jgi:cell division transport system permease protein